MIASSVINLASSKLRQNTLRNNHFRRNEVLSKIPKLYCRYCSPRGYKGHINKRKVRPGSCYFPNTVAHWSISTIFVQTLVRTWPGFESFPKHKDMKLWTFWTKFNGLNHCARRAERGRRMKKKGSETHTNTFTALSWRIHWLFTKLNSHVCFCIFHQSWKRGENVLLLISLQSLWPLVQHHPDSLQWRL